MNWVFHHSVPRPPVVRYVIGRERSHCINRKTSKKHKCNKVISSVLASTRCSPPSFYHIRCIWTIASILCIHIYTFATIASHHCGEHRQGLWPEYLFQGLAS